MFFSLSPIPLLERYPHTQRGMRTILVLFLAVTCLVAFGEAGFLKARYRHNMFVGEDGEDERIYHRRVHKRQKEVIVDEKNPPLLPYTKKSRSYHYNYGPIYPSHHNHLRNQHFPLPKNQLLHP